MGVAVLGGASRDTGGKLEESRALSTRLVGFGTAHVQGVSSGTDLGGGLRRWPHAKGETGEDAHKLVTVRDLVLVAMTDRAYGVALIGEGKVKWWLPRTRVVPGTFDKVGDCGSIRLPLWLAKDRGLVYEG